MKKKHVMKLLSSMAEIAGRSEYLNTYECYEMASGMSRRRIFKDIPKMRYYYDGLCLFLNARKIIKDVSDMYEGNYKAGVKERIANIKNLIISHVHQLRGITEVRIEAIRAA